MMGSKGVSPVVATVLLMGIAIAAVSSAAVFLQGTMDDLQDNVEGWLGQQDKEQASSIAIDYANNGTDGYLLVDLRNDGSRTITLERDNSPLVNMYMDGVPEDWDYISGSGYQSQDTVRINPTEVVTLNTTVVFPADGDSVGIEIAGPYSMSASYLCFSENGACET
jgi:flagellin-like protein